MNNKNLTVCVVISCILSVVGLAYMGYVHFGLDNRIAVYIHQHPKEVIESVQRYQFQEHNKRQKEVFMGAYSSLKDIIYDVDTPHLGNLENAKNKVVVFFDHNCSYCRKSYFVKYANDIVTQVPDTVVFFKDVAILGRKSEDIVKVMLGLFFISPEKYFEVQRVISDEKGLLSEAKVVKLITKATKLNEEEFYKLMSDNSSTIDKIFQNNQSLVRELGVQATPSFIVNDNLVVGGMPLEDMILMLK
ncbi:MAG: hypothetical protein P857_84 [Candidatus Xenolissoclinum pacificiensis L6]|uniref:Thioredoxin-like fold domain-containing protein n=1 Tax=Candidatus Xenolissoclinum pacificiensis L6 TaxID=1401685 RepID=W2UYJ6_9RICK|nr:MAG: hypothetical protein P857_84 [Candidatus Xenolissoclinum pacificiensis L6]